MVSVQEVKQLKKTDGSKRSRISGIAKLDDANLAGTRNGKDCTLILTEGDSAKALAVSGLSVVGRDKYGVFPLRGKLLNVREAKSAQMMKNEEITNVKKILGLQQGKVYHNTETLRYGHVMIMTDQVRFPLIVVLIYFGLKVHDFPWLIFSSSIYSKGSRRFSHQRPYT